MPGLLDGKPVVITGAGGGLGRSYALAVSRAGGRLVVSDVDECSLAGTVEALRAVGAAAIPVVGDISQPDVGRRAISVCLEEFGRIDGLVNNAAISRVGPSWEATDVEVDRLFGVNVTGVIAATSAALPVMIEQSAGSVVNVISGAILGMPRIALYGQYRSVSKVCRSVGAVVGARWRGVRV